MFTIAFYIFSALLSYTDIKSYTIPNISIGTLFVFLLIFGFFESRLDPYGFALAFGVLALFIIILMISPKLNIGGGDIKYMMVVAIYLEPILFALFILLSGIVQTIFLIYFQKIKGRLETPMVPAMFIAVILAEMSFYLGIYPF